MRQTWSNSVIWFQKSWCIFGEQLLDETDMVKSSNLVPKELVHSYEIAKLQKELMYVYVSVCVCVCAVGVCVCVCVCMHTQRI